MRLVKAKAKELMLSGENHLMLIFSIIIIGVTAVMPQLVFSIIYGLFIYPWADVLTAALTFLLVLPIVFGLLSMVKRMADGEKCVISDLFECFCSAEAYFRSLALGFGLVLVAALNAILLAIPFVLNEWLISLPVDMWISDAVSAAALLVALALAFLIDCRLSLFSMLFVQGEGVFRAMAHSVSLTKGRTLRLAVYGLSFLPLVMISIVAVLVPMLIYTAPYMLCAYAIGAKMICENNE